MATLSAGNITVSAKPVPLSVEQRDWYHAAVTAIDRDRLRELVSEMVATASPTGEERALAEMIVRHLQAAGVQAECQPIDDSQANAVGRIHGDGSGPALLLYAPIDTHMSGRPQDDVPWEADELRRDMLPEAWMHDDLVLGLGASNPKGHAACVIAAVEAIRAAQVQVRGDVLAGLGAGGMPSTGTGISADGGPGRGHGRGCQFMLDHGVEPDAAVVAKPGRSVLWEEAGLAIIEVIIRGRFDYAGVRHKGPYRNPIVHAARVIDALERWIPAYAARNSSGLVVPQVSIGAIQAGWVEKPTFVPAVCRLLLDLRLNPRTSPGEAGQQFGEEVERIRTVNPELDITWRLPLAVPGGATEPDSWVVQSCIRAWEHVEGGTHLVPTNNSGATDANILRGRRIPTARVGMPRVTAELPIPDDFSAGMNVVEIASMERLTARLVYTVVDTCTRTKADAGLGA